MSDSHKDKMRNSFRNQLELYGEIRKDIPPETKIENPRRGGPYNRKEKFSGNGWQKWIMLAEEDGSE